MDCRPQLQPTLEKVAKISLYMSQSGFATDVVGNKSPMVKGWLTMYFCAYFKCMKEFLILQNQFEDSCAALHVGIQRPLNSVMYWSNKSRHPAKKDATTVIVDRRKKKSHVLQEIRHLRRTTHFLIPKLPFARLVRQIILEIFPRLECRIQASALEALQESTEMYIVQFFEDSVLLALHAKRVTLMRNDIILMRRLRGRNDIINR